MAEARRTKLKVFQAQFGFFDTVVAAPSQAAALRAWGTHQNLFASGDARVTTDEAAVKAALEHPETPLRRPVGSNAPFELEPKGLPDIPDAPKRTPAPKPLGKPAAKPKAPADRSKLDAAEAALRTLDERRKAEEAAFRAEEEALEERKSQAQAAYVDARKAATAAVVAARQAYRKAGGAD
ncbi:MAG TPA: hypothetical protein VL460_11825 [Caulobacteraceae bacterium]|jgi:hypothetical protein|nr:hypothetical protein [Caulobacteraceae bacterium]